MTVLPICADCKHLVPGTLTCAAFPEGIPTPILLMERDHRTPYPNDRGIRFEPRDDTPKPSR